MPIEEFLGWEEVSFGRKTGERGANGGKALDKGGEII